jgi:predicted ribosome quality control (RQC) complex YloA/Tae2 family protein
VRTLATEKQIPKQIADQLPRQFVLWLREFIIDTVSDINSVDGGLSDLSDEVALKAGSDHNHNLDDLVEKSYNSLDDKPDIPSEADVVADGPTAVAISAVSCPSGADTIDRTTFNTTLSTMTTEINNLKDDINSLTTVHDDLIDKLQAAGLMGT